MFDQRIYPSLQSQQCRNKKVTLYMPPRNRGLESAEKVLSADDAAQGKQLTRQ